MKRRHFIKTLLTGMAALPLLGSRTGMAQSSHTSPHTKVIVVGAGMAGLATALHLQKHGVEVQIIEAQAKVGGRIRTDRSLAIPFDEGASWIHGPRRNPISNLARRAGAETFRTDDFNLAIFDTDGSQYPEEMLNQAEELFESYLDAMNGTEQESFADVFYREHPELRNNRLWTFMLSAYLEFDTGGDISELSSLDFYDDKAFRGADLIITNGYDTLTNFMANGLDISLNTAVESINYEGDGVMVTTKQASFAADYVVVTVPLGVLKHDVIHFNPILPENFQDAIAKLYMGSVNKYLCLWDEAFWDSSLQYIGYTAASKGKFNYFLNLKTFSPANALMTFTFGDYSKEAELMSDAEVTSEIMKHLSAIYGSDTPEPTTMLRSKWHSNPYSYGAYSFASKQTRSDIFDTFTENVDGKLFFAGEHTSRDYRGTVHGAYLSGIRAANNLLELSSR